MLTMRVGGGSREKEMVAAVMVKWIAMVAGCLFRG